jgi:hypothetical protein
MTPRGYAHGGIANTRQGYLFGGLTRTISKALGKIIPNEVKPFLPYIAAIAPFTAPFGALAEALPGFGLGQFAPMAQRALAGSLVNSVSQMSQKDFNQRGFNPLSNLLAAGTAGLSGPGTPELLGGERTLGMIDNNPITISKALEGGSLSGEGTNLANLKLDLPMSEQIKNAVLSAGSNISKPLEAATNADLISMDFAKGAAGPVTAAATEQAYNAAKDALDKYNSEQGAIGAMGVADQSKRKDAIIHAMQLAGFDQTGINSALSRLGLADGGSTTMPKFIPMDPESVGLRLFGKNIDNLSYIEKQAVRDYIDDNKNKKADGGLMSLKGHEMDFRDGGGFVPIGKKERADDVPARLSKNEFVFTAKAVRNAGGGDIKHGAKRMYQLMKHLEAK